MVLFSAHRERLSTHISLVMNSSRFSTLAFASAWSCFTRTGPMSLYTVFLSVNVENSWSERGVMSPQRTYIISEPAHLLDELVLRLLCLEPLPGVNRRGHVALYLLELRRRRLQAVLQGYECLAHPFCVGCGGEHDRPEPLALTARRDGVDQIRANGACALSPRRRTAPAPSYPQHSRSD